MLALLDKDHFRWWQLLSAILEMWKNCFKQMPDDTSLLVVGEYHLIRGSSIVILEKSNSRELYSLC